MLKSNEMIANISNFNAKDIKIMMMALNNFTHDTNSDEWLLLKDIRIELKAKASDILEQESQKIGVDLDKKRKAQQKRDAVKAEKNKITKDGEEVSLSDMIDDVAQSFQVKKYDDRGYMYKFRFIQDVAHKTKLTSKQHNFLSSIAANFGYVMTKKQVRKTTKKEVHYCDHEDLGSMGHRHGDIVKCNSCGNMAEVW